jgi:hypothetical protein
MDFEFIQFAKVIAIMIASGAVGALLGRNKYYDSLPKDYRIYPDRNRWSRAEVIAIGGLLVAILGLVVALFRR